LNLINLEEAKIKLTQGDVVAIPTETVYGLAGWIQSEAGLKKIFSTKERPFFDPLIVHIDTIDKAMALTSTWTKAHQVLADNCWPGPLTLIAPKNASVNSLITSGLDSVGLRIPNHPETLKLLSMIEGGLAAPSANKFGKTSPTNSQHVNDEFGESVSVLEGGPSTIGIESTVVGVQETAAGFLVEIYRPGFFTASMLKKILAENKLNVEVVYAQSPVAPGQLKHHYMPKIPLVVIKENTKWSEVQSLIEKNLGKNFSNPKMWSLSSEPVIASRELYEDLRTFDLKGFDIIITPKLASHSGEEWLGIWNRLNKAQSLDLSSEQ
jgi:L-threonylcarbamoyladenylate synthase